jgi:arylsulfatase A-like enzyme
MDFKKNPQKMARAMSDLYDAEIIALDTWFGEFVKDLKSKKIYHQSMIIFLSDHGEEFYEHNFWTHTHSVYNEVIKVPLIIKFPRERFKGKKIKKVVSLVDIMPTILNYYHISQDSETLDGKNLLDLIDGSKKENFCISSITSSFHASPKYSFKIALINSKRKIIFHIPFRVGKKVKRPAGSPKATYEYYDFHDDPREKKNLYVKYRRSVKKYRGLFNIIIKKALTHLGGNRKTRKIDKEAAEVLKGLGYL